MSSLCCFSQDNVHYNVTRNERRVSIRMASRQLLAGFVRQWNATVKQLGVFSPCFCLRGKICATASWAFSR